MAKKKKKKNNSRKPTNSVKKNLAKKSSPSVEPKKERSSVSKLFQFILSPEKPSVKTEAPKGEVNSGVVDSGLDKIQVEPKISLQTPPTWLFVDDEVMRTIENHAYSNLVAEVGGMLFGSITADRIDIVGSVPARNAAAEQISLTFTHEVWEEILAEGSDKYPGSKIVGWYHTHPGFGLFLSDYDKFIQNNFFSEPKQVALVVDPISGHFGWFGNGDNGAILELGVAETNSGPKIKPEISPTSIDRILTVEESNPKRMRAVVGGIILATVSGLVGYGLSLANRPVDLTAEYNALRDEQVKIQNGIIGFQYIVHKGETWESLALVFFGSKEGVAGLKLQNPDLAKKELKEGDSLIIYAPDSLQYLPGYNPVIPEETPAPTVTPSPSTSSTKTPTPLPSPGSSEKP